MWIVSTNRADLDWLEITNVWVLMPPLKKRTPFIKLPEVMPVPANRTVSPDAKSSAVVDFVGIGDVHAAQAIDVGLLAFANQTRLDHFWIVNQLTLEVCA